MVKEGAIMGSGRFALRIQGDSMYPRYMPGDIIIVDPDVQCETGDHCIVCLNGQVTFRQIEETEDKITLVPLNKDYKERVVSKNRKTDVLILGKVVDMRPEL